MISAGHSSRTAAARWAVLGACVAVTLMAHGSAAHAQQPRPATEVIERALPRLSQPTRPEPAIPRGREVEVVFVGSSSCGAAGRKDLEQVMDSLRAFMLADGVRRDYAVTFTGVALDWSVPSGLAFLEPFGPFDELSVGRNWMNANAVRYVWRDLAGKPEIPQLVVLERTVDLSTKSIVVGEDRLVERITGADDIVAYVRGLSVGATRK